eukprot:gnl/TRDRNA2_/TRDRNA2_175558_c2_seq4.p2 gnl/TRDRNA2_/TRDRNA2_175558_c2~~gnl/TRDRNA2_/TRDRNA2_175558_c2_seq4.p2  ORF type:complete len:152 (-),score=31.77 gnl/TRDRNA2_/TRDRNA2_175558_c2_seq4:254-709(-)
MLDKTLFHNVSRSWGKVGEEADKSFLFVNNRIVATIGAPLVQPSNGADPAHLEVLLRDGAKAQPGMDLLRSELGYDLAADQLEKVERDFGIDSHVWSLLISAGADPEPMITEFVEDGSWDRLQVLISLGATVSEQQRVICQKNQELQDEEE